jgi:hypothetical protein
MPGTSSVEPQENIAFVGQKYIPLASGTRKALFIRAKRNP